MLHLRVIVNILIVSTLSQAFPPSLIAYEKKSSDYIRAASIESMSALAEGRSTLSLTVTHTSSRDMELTQTRPCRCLFLLTS